LRAGRPPGRFAPPDTVLNWLERQIRRRRAREVASTGPGTAEFSKFKSDFSLSARRAVAEAVE